MSQKRDLDRIIAPAVEALGFELVGCEWRREGSRNLLQVFIDGPSGVTIDNCTKVSRQVSAVLDVEDPVKGRYDLEVSSPGIERPLYKLDHYRRFIGRPIKMRLRMPKEGRRQWKGVLTDVSDKQVTLQVEGQLWVIEFIEIEKANLLGDFSV